MRAAIRIGLKTLEQTPKLVEIVDADLHPEFSTGNSSPMLWAEMKDGRLVALPPDRMPGETWPEIEKRVRQTMKDERDETEMIVENQLGFFREQLAEIRKAIATLGKGEAKSKPAKKSPTK